MGATLNFEDYVNKVRFSAAMARRETESLTAFSNVRGGSALAFQVTAVAFRVSMVAGVQSGTALALACLIVDKLYQVILQLSSA